MTFNPVIWDALCYANVKAHAERDAYWCDASERALEQYASACDGKVRRTTIIGFRSPSYDFIPNPIPKY